MTAIIANILVLLVLGVVVFFAARSLMRTFKKGGCAGCSGGSCGCGCGKSEKKAN